MLRMKHNRFFVRGPSGAEISVLFKPNARARRLILKIDQKTGTPTIIAPSQRDAKAAEKFVKAKADWLEKQLSQQPDTISLIPGTVIPVEGMPHELVLPPGKGQTRRIEGSPNMLVSPGAEITFASRVERYLRMAARKEITARVDVHAGRLRVDPRRITIRDTRTRWGSCSSKGHLNFSWRLILAPPEILDYVVAHEVAHLIEMNHSSAFWNLVEESYGPHTKARTWLRKNGRQLHAVGSAGSDGG